MNAIKQKLNPLISAKKARRLVAYLIFVLMFEALLFPPAKASASENNDNNNRTVINTEIDTKTNGEINTEKSDLMVNENSDSNEIPKITSFLPKNDDIKIISNKKHVITAYNSEVSQCDSAPCITANGFNVCQHGVENTIAANWLEFGTKVRIPELFGDRVFIVRDLMNRRFSDNADIWFKNRTDALKFGVKIAIIEVLEP